MRIGDPRLKRWTAPVGVLVLISLSAPVSHAQAPVSGREWLLKGAKAYEAGDYAGAVEAYTKAREMIPDRPEVAYNLGAAHYQLGDLPKARELFTESLQRSNRQLEGQAKFNLGNVAYAEALRKLGESEKAANLLKQARSHYRDAIEVDPKDEDARANIELAQQLLKQLMQQQQQQQQSSDEKQDDGQDKQQDEQQGRQESQPEPESQPNSQPSQDAPAHQNQGEPEEQKPEPSQSPEKQPEDGDSQKSPSEEQDIKEEASPNKASADDPEEQDNGDASQSPDKLLREEAERLLQSVRDRERQRREELVKRRQAARPKVKKDW
jgi:Ca-activated chloride channel family protein